MVATPGGGISLFRLLLVSVGAVGSGMTDAVFFVFIIESLLANDASTFIAYLSLAIGSLSSMFFAPLVTALSAGKGRRQNMTVLTLAIGALCALVMAFVFGSFGLVNPAKATKQWRVFAGVVLAIVYRASIQACPIVPNVMDAAKFVGNEEDFPVRRDLALSGFYLSYRIGLLVPSIILSSLPKRNVANIFPIMLFSSLFSMLTVAITAFVMPREPEVHEVAHAPQSPVQGDLESEAVDNGFQPEAPPSAFKKACSDIREALITADRRLIACYVETLFYGIAYGHLAATSAPFYNEIVFKVEPGTGNGLQWAAYSAIIGVGVSLINDAVMPVIVFRKNVPRRVMTAVWFGSLLLGSVLFVAVAMIPIREAALVLFGMLALPTSSHGQFSLIAAGALVEPRLRSASFSVRSASLQMGLFIGFIAGGAIVGASDFRFVMGLAAAASFVAALAAFFVGPVRKTDYPGVAANANPLLKYIFGKGK